MGKAKKGLADKVRNKKKNRTKPQPNPFEVKINKVKHTVVNKKVQKWEKGTPGLSRSKAVKQRKDTLLRELHHMKKSNSLHDKRIGEGDSNLTADERMVQRFALEKKRQVQKGDFSLNEEEDTLTHYGQSLAENLQDTIGSDSEDEGSSLRTGNLQFGGFAKDGEVSWKDKMKDVIADSKKQKYERQVEKEKALEVTNELNTKWKTVLCSLKPVQKNESGKKVSSYLQLFHNLVMEQKSSGGTDKLKTEEERAKEEAEKLKKLETERVARMKGDEDKPVHTHASADDLNDCFALDDTPIKGRLIINDDSEGEEDGEGSEEGDGHDGSVSNEDSAAVGDEGDDGSDDEEEEDEDDSESDNYSDLDSDDESGEDEEKVLKKGPPAKTKMQDTKDNKKDLPFVYSAPGSFEELESLLHGHDGEEQAIILSRLRKCHHPSLAEGNKEKLQSIHLYALQYFGKLAAQEPLDKKLIGYVSTSLWETMQTFKAVTATALQKYITQRQAEFSAVTQRRKGRGLFPQTELLLHLALIENLFPTSDFRHPVCTPALNFMAQMLSECPVKDGKDIFSGLFLCSLTLKYVGLSKRYVPEVITFLHGALRAAACMEDKHDCLAFPPLRAVSKAADLLVLDNKCDDSSLSSSWSISDIVGQEKEYFESDQFKCQALSMAINLHLQCMDLWSDLPCLVHITKPLLQPLSALDISNYPTGLKRRIQKLKHKLQNVSSGFKLMQQPSKKPEPLKLFEPKIAEFWSGKRKKGGPNREANERQRLNHKYKREMKAAIREVKRDNEVLAKHQLEVTIQKDKERKRKMKDLMSSLANQEGDYKAIKRAKN